MAAKNPGPQPDYYARGWEAGVTWAISLVNNPSMTRAEVFDTMFEVLQDGIKRRAEMSRLRGGRIPRDGED